MRADIERWDRRYGQGEALPEPDPILTGLRGRLAGRGWALDVACGLGQNALWLASLGYRVLAVDGSLVALRRARAAAVARGLEQRVHLVAADLDRFVLPEERFRLVVVVKFLSRPLLPALARAVAPGGLIFYRTFNRNHLAAAPGFNPQYVLAPGELVHAFSGFTPLTRHDPPEGGEPLSHLLARRP